jgi:hypothetical protein
MSKIKVLEGLVSLGLEDSSLLLCPHVAFLLCMHIPGVQLAPHKHHFYWIRAPREGPHCILIPPLQTLSSNTVTF